MYKILVAEPDVEAALCIQSVITQEVPHAKVVAVVDNGNDAVIETMNLEPDLILVAIRMIGLNGLDVIERIRKFNLSAHIIIVSAYDYFEFAKKAMVLGVNDYLLKPIEEEALSKAIKRELFKVKQERESVRVSKNEEMQFSDALRIVEKHFLYSVVYGVDIQELMTQYKRMLGVGDYAYIIGVSFDLSLLKNQWNVEKASERMCRRLKDIIGKNYGKAIGTRMLNRFVLCVNVKGKSSAREGQLEAIKLAKEIVRGMKETFDLDVNVAIGGIKRIRQIHESYVEMMKADGHGSGNAVSYYKDVRYKRALKESYMDLTEELIDNIRYDKHNTAQCFFNILEMFRDLSSEERLIRLLDVFMAVSYEFRKEFKKQDFYFDYFEQYESLVQMGVQEQELWAQAHLSMLIRMMKLGRNNKKSSVVTTAMEHIKQHYNEDISLSEISSYVNLSPQHFSKIFKETTNFNYVEWVNNLRVEKAKEYMNQEDYTIKEICYLVGYKDPNYFSRIFKKYVGISPTEYVKERTL